MNTPKEIHRIFLIADLSGYTALTEAHGNISAAKVVSRYVEMVQEVLDKDARLAEKVGDEVLIVGTNAVSIIQMALNLCDKIENEPNFPSVHVAIHAGSVLKQDGQFFGSTLNVASRVAAYARACQILCTGAVIELITNKDNISYRQLGKVNLKNIIEPISIFEIDPAHDKIETNVTDPVCRMLVKPNTAPAHLSYNHQNYFFCSFECAKAFASRPDQYIKR